MNSKRAKNIRKILMEEIENTGAPQENKFEAKSRVPRFRWDDEKKKFVKTAKGVPFQYTADSPRAIYRQMKKAYARGDV
jgi:hypothetical protein